MHWHNVEWVDRSQPFVGRANAHPNNVAHVYTATTDPESGAVIGITLQLKFIDMTRAEIETALRVDR